MATGTAANFKIYNDYTKSGVVETLTQKTDAFNEQSRNTIRLTSVARKGNYSYESFFKNISGLVSRRIATGTGSTSAVTDLPLEQEENISVKLNRKIGPVANTLDSFKKIQSEDAMNELNYDVGVMAAKAIMVDQLNSAIRAGVAALNNQSSVKYTVPSNGTLKTTNLAAGLQKFGDAADRVILWVMHSKTYWDLVQYQITPANNGDIIANSAIVDGTPATLGRPVLITDSPSLSLTSGSPAVTDYYTLGLTAGALNVEDSEETTVVSEFVTGLENLLVRMQGEFAFNLWVKGFKYDVASGGANPADAAVATGTNWDPNMQSFKDYAGIIIQSR